METKPAVYSLSIGRMLALLVHYFAGYLYVYRIVATKITLAVEPGATILLPWVQLLIYVFTAGVAILLAWPGFLDEISQEYRGESENECLSDCGHSGCKYAAVFADWTFDADWKQRQSGRDSQCQYSVTTDDNFVNVCICADY